MSTDVNCFVSTTVSIKSTGSGVLDGKTVVLKDLFDINGHTRSFGHTRWRETHKKSETTAPLVTKLLEAGATITGFVKLDQLTYSLVGNVGEGESPLNSLYPDRFTGGSSSGSASAVAANLADIGIGTDTAGSIRTPAACCGLFGLRPTHSLIDSTGALPLAKSFDAIGILTKSPKLIEETLKVLINPKALNTTKIEEIKIPVDILDTLGIDIKNAVLNTAEIIAQTLNLKKTECSFLQFSNPDIANLFSRLQGREIWENYGEWIEENGKYLDEDVLTRLGNAKKAYEDGEEIKNQDKSMLEKYISDFDTFLNPNTVIILPIIPDLAPKRDAAIDELIEFRKGTLRLCAPSSLTGFPELAIPVHHKESNKYVGIGLIGRKNNDLTLLKIAEEVYKNSAVLEV